MKRHEHADLIHAWAEGAEIEYKNQYGKWEETIPSWIEDVEYRIKSEEPEWWENIPKKGVLCWVSDHNQNPNSKNALGGIVEYNLEFRAPYLSINGIRWRYATPLTNEDIEVFKR